MHTTRTCRICGKPDAIHAMLCSKCGPTSGLRCRGPDGAYSLRCANCENPLLESLVQPALDLCSECGSESFGWKRDDGQWASAEFDGIDFGTDRWVRAHFDGIYTGSDSGAGGSLTSKSRLFDIRVINGLFSDIQYIATPPDPSATGATPPLRQDEVPGMLVIPEPTAAEADTSNNQPPPGKYAAWLRDFRLHDWQFSSTEHAGAGDTTVTGRLVGTAYGRFVLSQKNPLKSKPQPPPPKKTPFEDFSNDAEQWWQKITPPFLREEGKRKDADHDCNSCSTIRLLVAAAILWVFCSWRAALLLSGVFLVACALHRWMCIRGIGVHRWKQPWRKWASLIIGLVLGAYAFEALEKSLSASEIASCSTWYPPEFWTLAFLLMLAGFQGAAWPRRLIKLLMIWATLYACHAGDGRCNISSHSASTPTTAPAQQAPPRPTTSAQTLANSVSDMVENVSQGLSQIAPPDDGASMLTNSNTAGANGLWLVSVGQAASNPEKVANCQPDEQGNFGPRYSVYLGEDAFFSLNSPKLNPTSSRASLRELLQFIEANPESKFVITGHTDSTGTDEVNIPLSLARANAVADWLAEGGVSRRRLRIVGAGSSLPLIRPTAEIDAGGYLSELQDMKMNTEFANRMNRRVEVAADCPLRATR